MQFPKLTPLQSRLAASLTTAVILIIIYLSFSPSHSAYAIELDSTLNEHHSHKRLSGEQYFESSLSNDLSAIEATSDSLYDSDFWGTDRGIIGRADSGTTALSNNVASNLNVQAGNTNYYVFPNASVWGAAGVKGKGLPSTVFGRRDNLEVEFLDDKDSRCIHKEEIGCGEHAEKRQISTATSKTVYVSINVCSQPIANSSSTTQVPQLTLFISTSQDNRKPGPDTADKSVEVALTEGFANYTLDTSGDVYIGVYASSIPDGFTGGWNYDLAASIDAPYHTYNGDEPFLFLVDSDTDSALLVTDNLTQADSSEDEYQQWMQAGTPFTMFSFPNNDTAIKGLQNSYCAMHSMFEKLNVVIEAGMTTRGLGNKPKEQFFLKGLNGSTSYSGFLAMRGNSTHDAGNVSGGAIIGGGGQIWAPIDFSTKTDGNCQLIFNLSFCSEVAYAVPSNPQIFNTTSLSQLYDNYTSSMYQNFNYSLQQIPCNTTSTAQYSLARNCTDCAADYKNWLCAVSIPRCEDFSSKAAFLQPRNVATTFINGSSPDQEAYENSTLRERLYANSSRNSLIDQSIQPGPYKEVLPCEDLCYSLIQSCPAKLGFSCPKPGLGLEHSYGRRSNDGSMTCSYLGAVYDRSASVQTTAKPLLAKSIAFIIIVLFIAV